MEKEILELLKKMDTRLSNLEEGQKEIKSELTGINKKLDGITDQTADLTLMCEILPSSKVGDG